MIILRRLFSFQSLSLRTSSLIQIDRQVNTWISDQNLLLSAEASPSGRQLPANTTMYVFPAKWIKRNACVLSFSVIYSARFLIVFVCVIYFSLDLLIWIWFVWLNGKNNVGQGYTTFYHCYILWFSLWFAYCFDAQTQQLSVLFSISVCLHWQETALRVSLDKLVPTGPRELSVFLSSTCFSQKRRWRKCLWK